jgi:sterol desaturase/sphingolipid hydroxylase (fatty acid hydroxylase superfamily)
VFPLVFLGVLGSATWSLAHGYDPQWMMLIHMLVSVVIVAIVERVVTYEAQWNRARGDVGPDLMHLLVSNVGVSALSDLLVLPLGLALAVSLSESLGHGLWPTRWPLVAQGVLAVVIAELPYYWFHRLSHEVEFLWRFHSVHHSAPRLYWLNAVRFHPVDAFLGYVVQVIPLVLLGAGPEVLAWHAIFLGVHGPFQHSNIDLKLGPLNWIFSMSELHRWHHSTKVDEGNTNYGGNLIVWDVVFGTRYLPKDRRPSAEIGVGGMPQFPTGYLGQLAVPFQWARLKATANPDSIPPSPEDHE